jgi:hypothetical protein
MNEFSEEASGASVTLRFTGTNVDTADDIEAETFAQRSKAPAKEDPGGAAYARPGTQHRVMTPRKIMALACAFVLVAIVEAILDALGASDGLRVGGAFAAWFLGFTVPTAVFWALERRAATPTTRSASETFTITVGEGVLSVEGDQGYRMTALVPEIATIAVDRGRVFVALASGKRLRLACRTRTAAGTAALAARLLELTVRRA